VVRAASLPLAWSVNHVRVTRPTAFDEAVSLAERHLAELPYRHLVVDQAAGGEQLADQFREAGWAVEAELMMVLAAEPNRHADTSVVSDTSETDSVELYRRWIAEAFDHPVEAQDQLVEYERLTWQARHARHLGVVGDSGALASMTVLHSDGTVAQVEDVYTAPEQRGRGFARALVTRALQLATAAGHELTFITADDNDWPRQLYAKLGFIAAGRVWFFTLRPGRER
jgi:predicted GNAT family acetyltransferase